MGYKSFVAWRYLLVANRKISPLTARLLAVCAVLGLAFGAARLAGLGAAAPSLHDPVWLAGIAALAFTTAVIYLGVLPHSKPSLILGIIGLSVLVLALVGVKVITLPKLPLLHLDPFEAEALVPSIKIVAIIGGVLTFLAMLFGTLRVYFTFFTTVPIGGVWIGTAALVVVLSVMGGFESDLREKILGSNAHLQISKEDGEFTEWREVQARIDKVPGVVASTPYAVSEVVVAANNTGANVIIKGIDPRTVGQVTDLVNDIEGDHAQDLEAMKRLEPLIVEGHDLRVPQPARTEPGKPVLDPPPDDLPAPGEPIDYSQPEPDDGGADAGAGSGHDPKHDLAHGSGSGSAIPERLHDLTGSDAYGGDAVKIVPKDPPEPARKPIEADEPAAARPVIDPPPPDLITSDAPPIDYSQPDELDEGVVRVVDVPFESPSSSRRTQSLPGVLVGRELVKQTHLFPGEEVHIVSPLSDPSNPDATGTPIPFNRDYRIAGTFFTGMYEYDLKYVYVTLASLQEFLDRGDTVDGIEIRVDNPYATAPFVARFVAELGPKYRIQDWTELNRSLFSALKLEKIAMFLVLGIVILVASFSIVGNLIMVVVEKAREIALLKTLGASDVGVMQLFAIQGLMIGVIGTLVGVASGLLVCWLLKQFGFPLNADVYYIDQLPVHIDPASVVAAASAGILISIAATIYPAVVAARVRPAAGMRH
jgi:lipoprotein-releasing system permease protein